MVSDPDTKSRQSITGAIPARRNGLKTFDHHHRFRQCMIWKSHDALYRICNPPHTQEEGTASYGIVVEEEL